MKKAFFALAKVWKGKQRTWLHVLLLLLFFAFLPISGALWAEQLGITGKVFTGTWQGQSGTTLAAEKTAIGFSEERDGEIVYGVRGTICVENGGEIATEHLAITDVIQIKKENKFQDYYQTSIDISNKPVLNPGEQYCYPYEIIFQPGGAHITYRNVAHVTIINHSGWLPGSKNCPGPEPCPFGPQPKAVFALPEPATPSPTETTPVPNPSVTPTPTESGEPPTPKPTPTPTEIPPQMTPTPTPPPPTEPPPTQPPTEPPPTEPPPTEPPPTEPPTPVPTPGG